MPDVLDRLKAALADRYAVERELGSGGMAVVYLAQDLRHERPVAIKVLRPELTSAVAAERFLQEIRITAGLAHPHILPLLDSGEADGLLYYVMPYVEGESLRDRLSREERLPIDGAVQISGELADALSYAHSHNLLHRDIKPENILFEAEHAVVSDFGIAKAISEAGGDSITQTGVAVGTPAYMSPEQASGDEGIDEQSDIYALGCVLYEMLAGETPHTGKSRRAILAKKLTEEPRSVRTLRPDVPRELDGVLQKALKAAPSGRFSTASEFAEALKALRHPSRRPTRRSIRWAAGAAVALAVWGIVAAGWMLFGRTEDESAAAGDRPSVAVLPLANRSGLEGDAYFTDGIHDEILTQLSKISGLDVRGRTSVMEYRDRTKNLRQIGEELNARYLLEGGVQRAGGTVRINVGANRCKADQQS